MRYRDPDGREYAALPRVWRRYSPVTWEFLQRHGWVAVEEPEPVPEQVTEPEVEVRYSRLKVRDKLRFLGLWEQVRALLQAGDGELWEAMLLSSDLRMSNAEFAAAVEQVAELLPEGMTAEEFLAGCEDTEVMDYARRR